MDILKSNEISFIMGIVFSILVQISFYIRDTGRWKD